MRRAVVYVLLGLWSALLVNAALAAPVAVSGAWLELHLRDPDVVVVDMTDDELQYSRYHIPGAVRLAYDELAQPRSTRPVPAVLPEVELFALLGRLGIGRDSHVVVYDDVGGLNAGRLFLELERIGHPRVSVVDGGIVRWVLENRRVDNIPVLRKPARYQAGKERRANVATLAEVRQASNGNGATLLDVRSRDEYFGDPRQARSGHIPGARWWPWEQAVRMESGFTFQEPEVLLASLDRAKVAGNKTDIILYCRSGHRAGQSYLTLRQLGFENVRVHVGSMIEYLVDRNAPLVRGVLP
jgi:thiosulfate/3-mercaptopyruvate sulfurtransferase